MKKFFAIIILFSLCLSSCKALKRKKCDCPDHRKKKGVAYMPANMVEEPYVLGWYS